jgi:hypothetical protein
MRAPFADWGTFARDKLASMDRFVYRALPVAGAAHPAWGSMRQKLRWVRNVLVGALCACTAHAQTETPDAAASQEVSEDPSVAQARDAFVLGTALARQGQWVDALAAFTRSVRARPHPVTTYNIAYCERALGRYTRARKAFKQALDEHAAGALGTLTPELLEEARNYLPEVERRLATAVVTLAPADTAVAVDGRPLELANAGDEAASDDGKHGTRLVLAAGTRDGGRPEVPPAAMFDLLLDPGRHVFVLSRAGAPDAVVEETFEAGATRPLVLTAPEPKQQAAPLVTRSPTPDVAPAQGADHTWTIVAYGVGAAGIVTGSIFGIAALAKKADLDDQCDPPASCPLEAQDDIDSAERNAMIANIGFGVGIAGAALGTYLLLTAESSTEVERARRTPRGIEPWLGVTAGGVRGRF